MAGTLEVETGECWLTSSSLFYGTLRVFASALSGTRVGSDMEEVLAHNLGWFSMCAYDPAERQAIRHVAATRLMLDAPKIAGDAGLSDASAVGDQLAVLVELIRRERGIEPPEIVPEWERSFGDLSPRDLVASPDLANLESVSFPRSQTKLVAGRLFTAMAIAVMAPSSSETSDDPDFVKELALVPVATPESWSDSQSSATGWRVAVHTTDSEPFNVLLTHVSMLAGSVVLYCAASREFMWLARTGCLAVVRPWHAEQVRNALLSAENML